MKAFPEGSLKGTRVFGELLAPRFAWHLADDVISSTFHRDENLKERIERLVFFRTLLKSSDEIDSSFRRRFFLMSSPLVLLNARLLRAVLLISLRTGVLLGTFGSPLFFKFVRKYSSNKEILGK
jgi:hypothetical protein